MSKISSNIPVEQVNVRIRADLAAKVRLLLMNPRHGKIRYGNLRKLMESLLTDWVQRVVKENQDAA